MDVYSALSSLPSWKAHWKKDIQKRTFKNKSWRKLKKKKLNSVKQFYVIFKKLETAKDKY